MKLTGKDRVRNVLMQKLSAVEMEVFKEDDLEKLSENSFITAYSLEAADGDTLKAILPGRLGVVTTIRRAFRSPEGETQPGNKRRREDSEPPDFRDNSERLFRSFLFPGELPSLPKDIEALEMVLFPEVHGKAPVTQEYYQQVEGCTPSLAEKYLTKADGSVLPAWCTTFLRSLPEDLSSETDTTAGIVSWMKGVSSHCKEYSKHNLQHVLAFNVTERTGLSYSKATVEKTRPDTLCIAGNSTLMVGEDKFKDLVLAREDLRLKVGPLRTVYYGQLWFILGYVAAGSSFQWVCLGSGSGPQVKLITPVLDLKQFRDRAQFLLSLVNAFHLLCTMQKALPVVRSDFGMYNMMTEGSRSILFLPASVQKTVREFDTYCEGVGTTVDSVREAYEAARGQHCLPQVIKLDLKKGTLTIEYSPVGYAPTQLTEKGTKTMAKCMCEALGVLHKKNLVHRDIRLPNIIQVSEDKFVLIELEAAAHSPSKPPDQGFFKDWDLKTLDDAGLYTTESDMHQLGLLLEKEASTSFTDDARDFYSKLILKQLSAVSALDDRWLCET